MNQAPITGESLPVPRGVGDEVFAGTINGQGALDVRVTRAVRDTTLRASCISSKPRRRSVRRRSSSSTASRAGTRRLWVLAALAGVPRAGRRRRQCRGIGRCRALVLLVVAVRARSSSRPRSRSWRRSRRRRGGVLIKGGAHLERLAGVRVVAFDKTGTLTSGEPEVRSVEPVGGALDADALTAAAAVEQRSAHPIAGAIVDAATRRRRARRRGRRRARVAGARRRRALARPACSSGIPRS